jgi:hypothetical protein
VIVVDLLGVRLGIILLAGILVVSLDRCVILKGLVICTPVSTANQRLQRKELHVFHHLAVNAV